MTDDVATQVLGDNDGQTRALYISVAQAGAMSDVHVRYLDVLERSARLDRALEQLPTGDELRDRVHTGGGLTEVISARSA
jgi:glutamate dehydrogenase